MRSRLPPARLWADTIRQEKSLGQKVGSAADYLTAKHADLATHGSVEQLALAADPESARRGSSDADLKKAQALVHNLVAVRAVLARELWERQIFVDTEVIDDLVFYAATDPGTTDVVLAVLERVRDARVNRPGFLVFPVHSLGLIGGGLLRPLRQKRVSFINPERGYALTPQTNDIDRSLAFLEDVRASFGVKKALPTGLLHHWRRSRGTVWLERNPLLVVRTIQWPGSYYGNEWLLLSRLRATAGTLSMLAALQPERGEGAAALFSSSMMNNWETLDIRHYFALYDWPSRKAELDGQCVPIHGARTSVTELSDLAIEIDPRHWRRNEELADQLHSAVENLYRAYLRQSLRHRPRDATSRTARRLFESLDYFRRSSARSGQDFIAKVSLATAFEMLLTDHYGAVGPTLVRRTRILLTGVKGTRAMQRAVGDLYAARSELVHGAALNTEVDLALARRAYVVCFIRLVEALHARGLPSTTATPIGDLTGD